MIGYMCAYLRYYYPKEFITSYLNNANNEDDIKLGTQLAKQLNIPIYSIKFRHSTAKYSCDENGIYKGISSVKFLNEEVANILYSIKDESFNDFVDFLIRINNLKIDSRKLEILIKLDFFAEFGNINYLLNIYNLFSKYYGKKQLKKDKCLTENLDFDMVRECCTKEIPKMFSGLNSMCLLKKMISAIRNNETTLRTKIAYQMECLGYVDIVDKQYSGMCVVVDMNTKYTPKLSLYALANGNTIPVKIGKKDFKEHPLQVGDIIHVSNQTKKPKKKKVDDKWIDMEEKEWWVLGYEIC